MTELKLRLHLEGSPESIIRVTADEFIIGRLPECDICLPFSEVSRNHSRLFKESEDQWFVEDMGSTNGTIVNQNIISGAYKLQPDDAIQIGNAFLFVSLLDGEIGKSTLVRDRDTILRSAEELQKQWLNVDKTGPGEGNSQRAIARLRHLVEIAKDLSSAESIEAIFEKVQKVVFQEIKAIQRFALLVDVLEDGDLQLIEAASRRGPEPLETHTYGWIGRSICKRVFADKVAIKTVDAREDERFEGEHSILAKGIRGALAVPIWDRDRVVGVLYADASLKLKSSDAAEDEEDLSFFSTLANLVAYSVQRWLLTRKLQEEAKIRQQLERYHSPGVVQQLIAVGALENGRLEPKEAEISIIFADIVGFSDMSELMTPKQIARLLDRFFEEMLKSVFDRGGTLDKFIGDCIMAFFGAPEPQEDHADRAVMAALEMLQRLDRLNEAGIWKQPLQLHIGINSGKAVVGDVGSSQRVDYTVLGAAVNLASRLEMSCPPSECTISGATYQLLRQKEGFYLIGERNFKGINRRIPVYQTRRNKK
ncbi:adenylate/guanylate cyclase domain-containing protein [Spirulina sp. 06S082]|uniref:adenylate/guanylate cyclase domain-containing protein n=1 Tax=Spirulina sp. 06S082 TaxID=3110248 RepID=UPI002B1F3297|nr:adenylate/guanylate cyclase domain-containing protein [Spirulina sp. 06S082]MEA5471722.1 adenylate/guanylate cyclase domain-containing protein [Spirulina sp. 06S082]